MNGLNQHFHYDCPLCSEEAIPERCPAYRIEWTITQEEYAMNTQMIRVFFKDSTYMDMDRDELHWYDNDPSYSHWEELYEENEGEEYVELQNGKRII